MDKFIASIGNFYNSEDAQLIDVPADEAEIHAKIIEIMDRCPSSTELSDDDFAVLRAYLPAIGCAEATQDNNGSLQGKEVVANTAEGCGIEVEKSGTVEVVSRWHAERKQWSGDMSLLFPLHRRELEQQADHPVQRALHPYIQRPASSGRLQQRRHGAGIALRHLEAQPMGLLYALHVQHPHRRRHAGRVTINPNKRRWLIDEPSISAGRHQSARVP